MTTPHPSLTSVHLGHSSLQLKYNLEIFSTNHQNTSSSSSGQRTVHVGRQSGATVQHDLEDGEVLLSYEREHDDDDVENSWVVVDRSGRVSPGARVNTLRGHDPTLPGWFRLHNGHVVSQSSRVLKNNVHVSTRDCQNQQFTADLTSLNLGSGLDDVVSDLVWDGKTVTSSRSRDVQINVNVVAPESVTMFSNKTRLGSWSADIIVTGAETLLNITTHQSHGLVLGTIDDISFSFTLTSPAPVSHIVTRIPIISPGLTALHSVIRVCLRVVTMTSHHCQHAPVTHLPSTASQQQQQLNNISVREIPVLWHHDKPASVK